SQAEAGRKRLAFNELLMLQIKNVYRKLTWQKNKLVYRFKINAGVVASFVKSLPFTLTDSQESAIKEILEDIKRDIPMNRLLEGDVGSGKTVVAGTAIFASFVNGYQSVVMAPTQILAQQHYQTLGKLYEPFGIRVALITSETKKKDVGKADVFIGTHALIQRKIDFDKVGLVVIDEQHRFGVEQRAHLVRKVGKRSYAPHVLTMTATPIPRTVALTFYGDLDLSTLRELPKGRKKITTWVVPRAKRDGAYKWIKEKIKEEKIQTFIVCPLIEESQKETMAQVRAATKEYANLNKVFKDLTLGLLHGKMPAKDKNTVLDKFREGKVNILVSTPVVEVGIDVPNATIMLVEAAERFGLAQLHQLRGRVGRGERKSYCLLFSESKSQKVVSRLYAMTKDLSGFELAELDLTLRGPGEVFGTRQHGFPELKIATWDDIDLIRQAKKVAEEAFLIPERYSELHSFLAEKQIIAN
ncbi:MAG: ATP-dependent DNA helicase RecG, partial [Patescibacteria group bacterium]